MFKSFIISFKLKNAYRVNSIIYSIKQLPIIKKILPDKLYQNNALKIIGTIISILIELGSIFIGKLLYIITIFMILPKYSTYSISTFLHIFTFFTIVGALLNTYMFNPTKDKYYAMILMNMNAKEYTLSNYFYSLIKVLIGFTPFILLFGLQMNMPWWLCIILPIFVVMIKMTISAYNLFYFERTKIARNENLPTKITWTLTGILLLIALGAPSIGICITQPIFIFIFIISCILGFSSLYKINSFNEYKKMYRQILTKENVYVIQNQNSAEFIKETAQKQIILDSNLTSNKNGYAYFHDIFVKRHRKILTEAVKKQAAVILFIVIGLAFLIKFNIVTNFDNVALNFLPYFVFIMYLLNRGTTVTQAMFMNCDHSMLTYSFYKSPKVILGLFKERLKTLILVNLLPAGIIACALPALLFISGGTNNMWNYVVLFVSIIALSIFFSVHYLVMYYLLQPYNINTEIKSSTYKVIQGLTYFVCYFMVQLKLPTFSFGIVASIFCIMYSLLSLYLVYKYAPKTFKIRI